MEKNLVIHSDWNKEDATFIRKNLIEYNMNNISENDKEFIGEDVSITLKDEEGNILGGITGYTQWYCLHVQIFWINEELRGKGYGKKLLTMAEELAAEKKCRLVKLDTFSFQAPEFYKKQGYEVYGTVKNFPEGFNHYFLFKKI